MKTYLQTRTDDLFDALDPFNDFFRPIFYDEKFDSMRTDIRESDQSYELDIELPGFDKSEISVSLENGYLTVGAKKEERGRGRRTAEREGEIRKRHSFAHRAEGCAQKARSAHHQHRLTASSAREG